MRELTKSTLSAGLAMSLFGMQTILDAFRRSSDGSRSRAAENLDAVTEAMVDRSGDILRETFHMGDRLQRGLIGMTFGLLTLEPLRRGGGLSVVGDATRQATDQMRQWIGGMGIGGGRGSDCGCSGADSARKTRGSAAASSWPGAVAPPQQPQSEAPTRQGWGSVPDLTP